MCMPREGQEKGPLAEPLLGGRRGTTQAKGTDGHATIPDLSALMGSKHNCRPSDIEIIGAFLRKGTLVGVILWIFLTALALYIAPSDSFEYLEGAERDSCIMVFILLLVTNGSRIIPLAFRDNSFEFIHSGVMVGLMAVEAISLASIGMMTVLPTPVLIDNVTGMRIHYIRWSSWTALAFLMTFLVESIDLPLEDGGTAICWWHAVAMLISCGTAMVFPHCPNLSCWLALLSLSVALFGTLLVRIIQQRDRLAAMKSAGLTSEHAREAYDRTRCSYRLLVVCCGAWTLVAITFALCSLAPTYAAPGSLWSHPSMVMVVENVLEAVSKIWYLAILIDTHELVFDQHSRATRKLEDLRSLMTAVWGSSSDVIARCVRTERGIDVVVSPAFLRIAQCMSRKSGNEKGETQQLDLCDSLEKTLVMEVDRDGQFRYFTVNLTKRVTRREVLKARDSIRKYDPSCTKCIGDKNMGALAALLLEASFIQGECKERLLMHDFLAKDSKGEDCVLSCEAKVTHLQSGMILVLLRDISERFRRFEAEKRLIKEETVRRKDNEANRFSRHEVKNGLLAAIGLVDSLQVAWPDVDRSRMDMSSSCIFEDPGQSSAENGDVRRSSISSLCPSFASRFDFEGCLQELDQTLREVLNTVLDEAMCKEVIYEEYEPKKERVNVHQLLSSLKRHTPDVQRRFPLVMKPEAFPQLRIDPQLLRYIYQNAISNACKFGEHGGVVKTTLNYDCGRSHFEMIVENQPGIGHEELVKLSTEEANNVFLPGTQLETNHRMMGKEYAQIKSQSSGDGAWIMMSCAKTLGGKCEIEFLQDRTLFRFGCPVEAFVQKLDPDFRRLKSKPKPISFPENTYCIAIDDSKIQRKLLYRLLRTSGIPSDRLTVVGGTAEEIYSFKDLVTSLLKEYPQDKFLIIADENLDITSGGGKLHTVSGSLCIHQLCSELSGDDNGRILALVRSANDSSSDIALYRERAHGVLKKAPMKRDDLIEVVRPLWAERFSVELEDGCTELDGSEDDDGCDAAPEDVLTSLDVIDALFSVKEESALKARWTSIRDKLHMLKGDLKTMRSMDGMSEVVTEVDSLLKDQMPEKLAERWLCIETALRSHVKGSNPTH